MKKRIDANNGTATFVIGGQELDINLAGIDAHTYTYLALIGLHEMLVKRRHPAKSWQDIRNGILKKKKKVKPMVLAIADALDLSVDDAQMLYSGLSGSQKIELRKDHRVRKALIEREPAIEVDIEAMIAEPVEVETIEIQTVNQPDSPQPHRKKAKKKAKKKRASPRSE